MNLDKIQELGGKRLRSAVESAVERGYDFPMSSAEALRRHGIGRVGLRILDSLGMIIPPPPDPYEGLTVRAINVLENLNIADKESARKAILEGKLGPQNSLHIRNYGIKAHREVCVWAGLPEPITLAKTCLVCPHCGGNVPFSAQRRAPTQ